jgi:hypothetical protein
MRSPSGSIGFVSQPGQEMNRLGLASAATSYNDSDSGQERILHFQDWTVDGQPLRTLVGARPPQEMTPLSEDAFWPRVAVDHLRQLLRERPGQFADGRLALLVCPIDADLGCPTLSMRLSLGEGVVTWTEFGYQVDYEPFDLTQQVPGLEFRFDRGSYEAVVRQTLSRFAKLAGQ